MRKIYLALIIGILIVGTIGAGITLSANKPVDKDTKNRLDEAGLTDYDLKIDKYEDYWEVYMVKEGVVNIKKVISRKGEDCLDYYINETAGIVECLETEIVTLTDNEMNAKVSAFEDSSINRVVKRQTINNAKGELIETTETDVTITSGGVKP